MWDLVFAAKAAKTFRKLDQPTQKQIKGYMATVCALADPSQRGKALTGQLSGYWRYRVGNYRIICEIVANQCIMHVIDLGHRSSVYD
jgi:mRNA interferase RelE/StbE